MINQPDTQEYKTSSGKLGLPAPPAEEQQVYYGGQQAQLRPEQLIRPQIQPAPRGVGAMLAFYWRKDPAYKVLMIAMTMVLLAGIVFVSLASAAFLNNSNFLTSSSSPPSPQALPKGANPTGIVDMRPTFPSPGGGSGSNQNDSQPPMQPTPALQPTSPTNQPSATPGADGTSNVQITNYPPQVQNYSNVYIDIHTSKPGQSVLLVIRYNVQGGRSTAGPQTTDDNGNTTIPWFVLTNNFGQRPVQAFVYALAIDQNGQRTKSQTITIQVQTRGGG